MEEALRAHRGNVEGIVRVLEEKDEFLEIGGRNRNVERPVRLETKGRTHNTWKDDLVVKGAALGHDGP
jgi:hypothetical protein